MTEQAQIQSKAKIEWDAVLGYYFTDKANQVWVFRFNENDNPVWEPLDAHNPRR